MIYGPEVLALIFVDAGLIQRVVLRYLLILMCEVVRLVTHTHLLRWPGMLYGLSAPRGWYDNIQPSVEYT